LNTIIFSTHDIELAVELADSIYIIGYRKDGGQVGTIIKHLDLKEMGIAWQSEMNGGHHACMKEIRSLLLES
jgi:ABC-type nitrate/sulfonate/bicarbonate transport system ATPase subunit